MFLADNGFVLIAEFADKSIIVHSWSMNSEHLVDIAPKVVGDLGYDEEAIPPTVQILPASMLVVTQDLLGIAHQWPRPTAVTP